MGAEKEKIMQQDKGKVHENGVVHYCIDRFTLCGYITTIKCNKKHAKVTCKVCKKKKADANRRKTTKGMWFDR